MTTNFEVKERNTYSLAALVNPQATTSIAQFIQIQTLCYYYDIAVCCTESRANTCDLLTSINNAADAGKLPVRTNKKGRAYINKSGIMVFSDASFKPYAYQALLGESANLSLPQIKHVNNMLLKNYKQKGLSTMERASRLVPSNTTIETITKTMLNVVKYYKVTFDLNRELSALYEAQQKCLIAIGNEAIPARNVPGESYIENQVIRFKATTPVDTDSDNNVTGANNQNKEGVAQAASSSLNQESSSNTEAEVDAAIQAITEAPKTVETETKIAVQVSPLFIYSKPAEDKTARIIYVGNETNIASFSCAYRTSVKSCTSLGIQYLVQNGCKQTTIFIDKKADSFITQLDDFSSENDKCIQEIAATNILDLQVVDAKSEAYKSFVEKCI